MRIIKFGGSSIANSERIKNVIKIIKNEGITQGGAVFSAFEGVTDSLLKIGLMAQENKKAYLKELEKLKKRHFSTAKELNAVSIFSDIENTFNELSTSLYGIFLLKELSDCSKDFIVSFGERLSCIIITEAFSKAGIDCEYLDARLVVLTGDQFTKASVYLQKTYKKISKYFHKKEKLQIITGFIGSTKKRKTTTIGRGGSDYTAAIFATALNCQKVEIYTDVDGVKSANPKEVESAKKIPQMTYNEAIELSHFGAKIIYPPTIQPAKNKNIPILIKSTFSPYERGTIIDNTPSNNSGSITGISSIDKIALVRVQGWGMVGVKGIAARIFDVLAKEDINVILIAQASSEHSICFAINSDIEIIEKTEKSLSLEFNSEIKDGKINPITIEDDFSSISVIGEGMRHNIGIAGKIFNALGKNGINVVTIAQGLSEMNISFIVSKSNKVKAVNVIHNAFFNDRDINIFLLGTGLIGSTLINQMKKQKDYLFKEFGFHLHLRGIANTKKSFFGDIDLDNWKKILNSSSEKSDNTNFVKKLIKINLPNSIFLDCTASSKLIKLYSDILKASISIVTPNKKANSSSYKTFNNLYTLAKENNAKFLFETNVGAGLPIISTLDDLIKSGDKIQKIEAVLSGTISYIFNNLSQDYSFSKIVLNAKELGFTEPDPRDDLSGMDIARKVLILCRLMGIELEIEDIKVEKLLPTTFYKLTSVDDFLEKLPELDEQFNKRLKQCEVDNKKLRYVAVIKDKRAKIVIKEVDSKSPFFTLRGSDNMVVFTTKRYSEITPLIIRGPGAGAEVTAAGVFADIIKIANYLLI